MPPLSVVPSMAFGRGGPSVVGAIRWTRVAAMPERPEGQFERQGQRLQFEPTGMFARQTDSAAGLAGGDGFQRCGRNEQVHVGRDG